MVLIIMIRKENRAKFSKRDLNGLLGREKSDILTTEQLQNFHMTKT